MTVLTIILIVLSVFFALLLLLVLPKLSVRVICEDTLSVYAGFSFFSIKLYPPKEKKHKKKKEKKKTVLKKQAASQDGNSVQQEKNADSRKEALLQGHKEKKGKRESLSETVSFIFDIVKQVGRLFGKHGQININKLIVNVSGEDACDTAVRFGLMCSGVSAGLALCSTFGKSRIYHENVRVNPDFVSEKGSVLADLKISVRGIFVVSTAIKILVKKFLKDN
ncbi:MAG: hypothetical protein J6K12_02525 [Clostridia bacterium]|nr:hypothetical protein [Clostridia bacterium]